MTYARIDDHFDISAKHEELELEHFGLHACAIVYCNRHLTDGRISTAAIKKIGKSGRGLRVASRLLDLGLWRRTEMGFEIVGYLDHNESRAEVLARREAGRTRLATWKGRKREERVSNTVANALATHVETRAETNPSPLLSSPLLDPPLPPEGGTRAPGCFGSELEAYREGIAEGSGRPCAAFKPFLLGDIDRGVDAHAPAEAKSSAKSKLAWIRASAQDYAEATLAAPKFEAGYKPAKWVDWLNAGRPIATAPGKAAPSEGVPKQPQWRDPEPSAGPRVEAAKVLADVSALFQPRRIAT